ncbi:MAG: 2-succinyl-5-enolpyruvyl-6-hydroxy-3-cyclohexene-1-carboxylic-acid synthase [Bacteroidales bacterium]|nr:2-succinyl-5-enolpyruvyl-6-hydroxy-3-cyclohexene-1-carboxylic-acid synthase [Bacteroidales bacterium]
MYSIKKNIQQLISLMVQHHISDVVICPGSRNMPIAESLASNAYFHCHAITDERSAGFFAIGLSISLNKPVAVCVTSGSALLNLASAISEAYYQQIPLLVISADRPQAWIGQMDGQTLPQTQLFTSLLKKEVHLPEPENSTDEWYCNRLINEAILALHHHSNGPVHINIPISEPFFDCSVEEIEQERMIHRNAPYNQIWMDAQRPLFVVGQLSVEEAKHLKGLLQTINCPIFCEHLSNLGDDPSFIYNADCILTDEMKEEMKPDLVIYLGGHVVSKRIKKWIRQIQAPHCWRISSDGECADTFQCLTNCIEQTPYDFVQSLSPKAVNNDFLLRWKDARQKAEKNNSQTESYTALSVVQRFISLLPDNVSLILANSSAVRYAQTVPIKAQNVYVSCNRGVNGIDGSLSAAMGYATAQPTRDCYLIIGDLSFFYDMNGLWNNALPQNLKIILLNNGGGEIFKTLPGLAETTGTEQFVRACHHTSAEGWAKSMNLNYIGNHEEASVLTNLQQMMSSPRLTLVEFFF